MKKNGLIIIAVVLICAIPLRCLAKWDEESARQKVFKDLKYNIDISQYRVFDPNYDENQKTLERGQQRVGNRFITKNPEPPIGYIVSQLNEKNYPHITMFYKNYGYPHSVRLFSSPTYPRIAYIYCVSDTCPGDTKYYTAGDLLSVSLHIAGNEAFYFLPDGECTGHVKY